jgi:hypothetical protein
VQTDNEVVSVTHYFATLGEILWCVAGSITMLMANRKNVVDMWILSSHPGLELTQELSEIEKSRVASSTCSENVAKEVSKQPEAGSHDNRHAGAYISARIARGYVLHSSYSAMVYLDVRRVDVVP